MPLIMKDGKAYGQSPSGLSGLIDTNISSSPAGKILINSQGTWVDGTYVKAWTSLGSFSLTNNQTGTWTLDNSMFASTDILFFVGFGSNTTAYVPRVTLNIPYTHFYTYGAFMEFGIIGAGRQYVELHRATDTSITVSNTTVVTSVTLHAYCR